MKNVYEVLSQKEKQLAVLQMHVQALRLVAPLLHEEEPVAQSAVAATQVAPMQPAPNPAPVSGAVVVTNTPVPSGWETTAKRWP